MKRLSKWFRLNKSDRQLLLKAFIVLGLVRLGLWLLPFPTLRETLAKVSQVNLMRQKITQTSINQIVWAVDASSRYQLGQVKCLARALTTQVLMSWSGYSPKLCIGVAKGEQKQLEAHAWVENQGQVVIGYLADLSRFTPLLLEG